MIEIQVSKEMWAEWVRNPVTNAFFKDVRDLREQIKEEIARGYHKDNFERAIGKAQAFQDILNTTFVEDSPND